MSVRSELAAHFKANLPTTFTVWGYARDAVITGPTVLLWQNRVEPFAPAPDGGAAYSVELTCWVLTQIEDIGKADDALDASLDLVLDVWNGLGEGLWESAERLTLDDRYHGYKITARAVGRNGA